ncbi:cupin domain-containing protein [Aureimonas altamirensis]|uniref:cupin domain-containing protein n=1 Tax=Aureimonas altamirensis TaxID=370622 RepID=UPI0024782D0F|nr:cupin domain-containing protein [Aureimonas altamirensis]
MLIASRARPASAVDRPSTAQNNRSALLPGRPEHENCTVRAKLRHRPCQSGRPATQATLFDPAAVGPWLGPVAGIQLNGPISDRAYGTDETGAGPPLHVRPYDGTSIVVEGRARFRMGEAVLDAVAGEVVLGPAGVPHRFENLGPDRLQTIDIRHSPEWIQTDLEDQRK